MNIKNTSIPSAFNLGSISLVFALICLTFLLSIVHCLVFGLWNINLVIVLFIFCGLIAYVSSSKPIFLISYCINTIFMFIWQLYFLYTLGDEFTPGRDDQFFFKTINYYMDGTVQADIADFGGTILSEYSGFLFVQGVWGNFIQKIFHYSTIPAVFFIQLNILLSSVSSLYLFKAIRLIFNKETANRTIYIYIFFPFVIYFSSVLLRDVYVLLCFNFSIYFLALAHKFNKAYLLIGLLFVGYSLIGVRFETGLVNLCIYLGYIFYSFKIVKYFSPIIIFLLASIFWNDVLYIWNDIFDSIKHFQDITVHSASSDSIGAKIALSSNPLVRSVIIILSLYNPIPPFTDLNLSSIFIDIGALFWYSWVPITLFTLYNYRKHPIIFALIIGLIPLIIIQYVGSGMPRHRLLYTPVFIMLYVYGKDHLTDAQNRTVTYHNIFLYSLILFYVTFIKWIK